MKRLLVVFRVNGLTDRIAIVVPTYWTRPGGLAKPGDAVYDHPTPVDEDGTLGRLLDSLANLDTSRFYVVVIVAVTNPTVGDAASARVREILAREPRVTSLVVDHAICGIVGAESGLADSTQLVGLTDYSRVRNLQLLIPLVLGESPIVALDDDEVVRDHHFLERATDSLGMVEAGHEVAGLGGYYEGENGSILLDVPNGTENSESIFDRKAAIMNAATEQLEALPGEIVPTPFCFGGNMVFSSSLAGSVAFDPGITRGEDIDYLINARLDGKWFFMNKQLRIVHLPPKGGSYQDVAYHKVVQDVLRFVYERAKLEASDRIGSTTPVTANDLNPYPGRFLQPELESYAEPVIQNIIDSVTEDQRATLGLPATAEEFFHAALIRSERAVDDFRRCQEAWPQLVSKARSNGALRQALLSQLDNIGVAR